MNAVLALDQGTTSSRAIVFGRDGAVLAVAQNEFRQIYPHAGWVEHDPLDIWTSQLAVAREALAHAGLKAADIAAIGIANQRETTVIWDRESGRPIANAIVWQDRRTAALCDTWKANGMTELVQSRTGLVIDAYFSASKVRWLLDTVSGARERAERGELAFGTVDSWLIWNLTGGACHVTDVTNASRTMLFNLRTGDWDDELLNAFGVPRALLPAIVPSSEVLTRTAPDVFGAAIPIGGVAGDQQAALFGQQCLTRGLAKNTYGTGCFMLMNIGSEPVLSRARLLTTVAWKLEGRTDFALEGSVFVGGAVVQWLRDGLGIIRSSADVEPLAASVETSEGVYFVPAFAGIGAPHWDQYARGTITGLTRGTTAAHLARAALEGIAFQVSDVLDVMQDDSGMKLDELRVDGGASANDLLMQFQADLLQVAVVRPRVIETTAMGAAWLAGLAVGFWSDREELGRVWQVDRTFEPQVSADHAAHRRARWCEALRRATDWEERR